MLLWVLGALLLLVLGAAAVGLARGILTSLLALHGLAEE